MDLRNNNIIELKNSVNFQMFEVLREKKKILRLSPLFDGLMWAVHSPLCEKYPDIEFFLVLIFPCSDWIRRFTRIFPHLYGKMRIRKNSVFGHFSRNAPKSYLFCLHHQIFTVAISDQIFDILTLTLFVHRQGCNFNFNPF